MARWERPGWYGHVAAMDLGASQQSWLLWAEQVSWDLNAGPLTSSSSTEQRPLRALGVCGTQGRADCPWGLGCLFPSSPQAVGVRAPSYQPPSPSPL